VTFVGWTEGKGPYLHRTSPSSRASCPSYPLDRIFPPSFLSCRKLILSAPLPSHTNKQGRPLCPDQRRRLHLDHRRLHPHPRTHQIKLFVLVASRPHPSPQDRHHEAHARELSAERSGWCVLLSLDTAWCIGMGREKRPNEADSFAS
jgi:hypothetical protein